MTDHLTRLREMREVALAGGGAERVADQKAKGKGTARERLSYLLDEGSFQEIGALATHDCTDFGMADKRYPGDGVVCGFAKINGRRVAVFAHDFTVLGGSFSAVQSQKICRLQDLALESGIPLIGLNDSGGGPASRRGSGASPPTARSSRATCSPRGSSPRSRWFSAPAREGRRTPPPSPTS
jgi:acetyl-CoA carboxylase carboxyltransferase component